MATTVSLQSLIESLLPHLWPGRSFLVETSAASGGTTTSLIIPNRGYSSASANRFDGVYVWVVGGTSNQLSQVIRAGFATSGADAVFTLSPALGANPNSSATIWFLYGLTRTEIRNAINHILNTLYVPAYLPLTLITDGDMEATGVTNWAAVGTPTTRAKTTTTARVLTGLRALQVVTDATGEGVISDNVAVHERERFLVSVPIMADAGDAVVQLRNITAGTTIDSVSVDEEAYTEVRFTAVVPDNCEEVAIRIISDTVAASTFYVGWASLLAQSRPVYNLPSQVLDSRDLADEPVYYLPIGRLSEDSRSYIIPSEAWQPWPVGRSWRDWRAQNSQRIEVAAPSSYPLFLNFYRSLPDLTLDADTTEAYEELVVQGALAELKRKLSEGASSPDAKTSLNFEAERHERAYRGLKSHYGLQRPRIKMKPTERVVVI